MIPKVIHQTWISEDTIPPCYQPHWRESWKKHHPDWEYRFWSDEALKEVVVSRFPDAERLMTEARGVVKADVGRMALLYEFGGLYVDLDYEALAPMGHLLAPGPRAYLGLMGTQGPYIHNAMLASEPRYRFWHGLVKDSIRRWEKNPLGAPEWICGSMLVQRHAVLSQVAYLPAKLTCPIDWRRGSMNRRLQLAENPLEHYPEALAITYWVHNW